MFCSLPIPPIPRHNCSRRCRSHVKLPHDLSLPLRITPRAPHPGPSVQFGARLPRSTPGRRHLSLALDVIVLALVASILLHLYSFLVGPVLDVVVPALAASTLLQLRSFHVGLVLDVVVPALIAQTRLLRQMRLVVPVLDAAMGASTPQRQRSCLVPDVAVPAPCVLTPRRLRLCPVRQVAAPPGSILRLPRLRLARDVAAPLGVSTRRPQHSCLVLDVALLAPGRLRLIRQRPRSCPVSCRGNRHMLQHTRGGVPTACRLRLQR